MALHVIKFHQYMDQANIHHEDALMKMFMYSLEGDARQWYMSLPISNISSLKDFNAAFFLYCKRIYPAECLFDRCCEGYALYIHSSVADSSSSVDEAYGYVMKEEEDIFVDETLSSFDFQLDKQEEVIFYK